MRLEINVSGDKEAIVRQLRSVIYSIYEDHYAQKITPCHDSPWQGSIMIDPELPINNAIEPSFPEIKTMPREEYDRIILGTN